MKVGEINEFQRRFGLWATIFNFINHPNGPLTGPELPVAVSDDQETLVAYSLGLELSRKSRRSVLAEWDGTNWIPFKWIQRTEDKRLEAISQVKPASGGPSQSSKYVKGRATGIEKDKGNATGTPEIYEGETLDLNSESVNFSWKKDNAEANVEFQERLRKERLGQGAFRAKVLEFYNARCLVTGCEVRELLEAAHIVPVGKNGSTHHISNSLCLRVDVHRLFDRGLLEFRPENGSIRVKISDLLTASEYSKLQNKLVEFPNSHAPEFQDIVKLITPRKPT